MFRRLYWVTERIAEDGQSHVTGVYTSIPNLMKEGMECNKEGRLRLTLTKLDSDSGPIATWIGPAFEGLREHLDEYVRTDEFSPDHCDHLIDILKKREASA